MKLENKISMIPFGLLAGFADEQEIRITELAQNGFQFRLKEECADVKNFRICFYDEQSAEYHEVLVRDFALEKERSEKFYTVYSVFTEQTDFVQEVQGIMYRYSRYIRLKIEEDDGGLAEELTGYPAEQDEIFAKSLEEQKKEWFRDVPVEKLAETLKHAPEFALELDRPEWYELYLNETLPVFMRNYWTQNGFLKALPGVIPDRLYIGNQFCHLLFPEEKYLFQLMQKAHKENRMITLVYTYIREDMLKTTEEQLARVDNWCRERDTSVEIVVNDWAMAEMLRKYSTRLIPVFGSLLNKRKKDPRMSYKKGDRSLYEQNNLNAEFYRKFLEEECKIRRYEWETCGYEQKFPDVQKGKKSLHFPYYQTNTSQYCPLHAVYVEGERGRQRPIKSCPYFCEKYALLYPKHLHMVGRYNSLLGVDTEVLYHPEKLEAYLEAGIDRLVLGL